MDIEHVKYLFKSTRQHIASAKHAKAIGWTDKGDLYEYSVQTAEKQLAELDELLGLKEATTYLKQ